MQIRCHLLQSAVLQHYMQMYYYSTLFDVTAVEREDNFVQGLM